MAFVPLIGEVIGAGVNAIRAGSTVGSAVRSGLVAGGTFAAEKGFQAIKKEIMPGKRRATPLQRLAKYKQARWRRGYKRRAASRIQRAWRLRRRPYGGYRVRGFGTRPYRRTRWRATPRSGFRSAMRVSPRTRLRPIGMTRSVRQLYPRGQKVWMQYTGTSVISTNVGTGAGYGAAKVFGHDSTGGEAPTVVTGVNGQWFRFNTLDMFNNVTSGNQRRPTERTDWFNSYGRGICLGVVMEIKILDINNGGGNGAPFYYGIIADKGIGQVSAFSSFDLRPPYNDRIGFRKLRLVSGTAQRATQSYKGLNMKCWIGYEKLTGISAKDRIGNTGKEDADFGYHETSSTIPTLPTDSAGAYSPPAAAFVITPASYDATDSSDITVAWKYKVCMFMFNRGNFVGQLENGT